MRSAFYNLVNFINTTNINDVYANAARMILRNIYLIPQSTNPIHKVQTYQKGEVAVLGTVLGPIDKFLLD